MQIKCIELKRIMAKCERTNILSNLIWQTKGIVNFSIKMRRHRQIKYILGMCLNRENDKYFELKFLWHLTLPILNALTLEHRNRKYKFVCMWCSEKGASELMSLVDFGLTTLIKRAAHNSSAV